MSSLCESGLLAAILTSDTQLINENIFQWHVALMVINPDSIYNGAFFKAKMTFPHNYPYSPPGIWPCRRSSTSPQH
jgi:ubiquitin-protein ligase